MWVPYGFLIFTVSGWIGFSRLLRYGFLLGRCGFTSLTLEVEEDARPEGHANERQVSCSRLHEKEVSVSESLGCLSGYDGTGHTV